MVEKGMYCTTKRGGVLVYGKPTGLRADVFGKTVNSEVLASASELVYSNNKIWAVFGVDGKRGYILYDNLNFLDRAEVELAVEQFMRHKNFMLHMANEASKAAMAPRDYILLKIFYPTLKATNKHGDEAYYLLPGSENSIGRLQNNDKTTLEISGIAFHNGIFWARSRMEKREVFFYFDDVEFNPKDKAEIEKEMLVIIRRENYRINTALDSNTEVCFNKWYIPFPNATGIKKGVPMYWQKFFKPGESEATNSYKCTLFSSITGYYAILDSNPDPVEYSDEMHKKHWSGGLGPWLTSEDGDKPNENPNWKEELLKVARTQLKMGRPIVVAAGGTGLNHMVVVVGYFNEGKEEKDFIVLDSMEKNPTTLEDFYRDYPNPLLPVWTRNKGKYLYGIFFPSP
ncbi:MAG: hypothetical protein FWH05_03490 [Oscillospiraceae bacterium]|nr:hypothetical protein [Oscillospiraceae bacterium]